MKIHNKLKHKIKKAVKNIKNMKVTSQLDSVLYMLGPLFLVENLFGKFRYRKVSGNIDLLNKTMKCYSIFTMLVPVAAYMIIFAYTVMYKTFTDTYDIVDKVDAISSMLAAIQYITSTALFLYYTENHVRIIKLIVHVDDILNISNNKQTYRDSRRYIQISISLLIFIYVLLGIYTLTMSDSDKPLVSRIILIFIDFERHLEVFSFYIFIKTITDRLGVVNSLLEQVIKIKYQSNVLDIPVSDLRTQIDLINIRCAVNNYSITHTLANSYDLIGEACNEINKVFKFHIFRALFTTFLYILIAIWVSIYDIGSALGTSVSLAQMIFICLFEIFSVGLMSYTCEILLLKRNLTKVLVNELVMDYSLTRQIRTQAKAFMELIDVWSLQIYAYDMITIDIKLILKFISVSTTYLIVIIQLSHFF
ncbi:uncharacterized protein LOC112054568 [Bicyclus anynana]|uniref:Gustatory receptor n=1 Tax=Bicyclus anynana TaxID=110368 RepID=A0A6J1NTU1_BICAN|nr:uncharacterized protein LOC112054568 [Bicyclus anynana]